MFTSTGDRAGKGRAYNKPLYPCQRPPLAASFTSTFNTITLKDKSDRLQVIVPSNASNLCGANRPLPATPWTIDMCFEHGAVTPASGGAFLGGIHISDGTAFVAYYPGCVASSPGGTLEAFDLWTNSTTYNSQVLRELNSSINLSLLWIRVTHDGGRRKFYRSSNGRDYTLILDTAVAQYITEVKCGIAFYNNSNRGLDMKVVVHRFDISNSILGDAS